jgi:hypothetical protein
VTPPSPPARGDDGKGSADNRIARRDDERARDQGSNDRG